jgi:hypothetical protein
MLVFMHSSPCVCLGWVQYFSMGMILGSQSKASRFSWEMSQGMPSTIALNCIVESICSLQTPLQPGSNTLAISSTRSFKLR